MHTYSVTLAAVLVGIVLGSFVAARLGDRVRTIGWAYGWLQALLGAVTMVIMSLPPDAWNAFGGSAMVQLLVLVPPATLAGASFPLVMRWVVSDPRLASADVGRLTAVNTAGGVLGSFATGFLLLPAVGMQGATWILTGLSLLAGLLAWHVHAGRIPRIRRAVWASAILSLWVGTPLLTGTRIPHDFLEAPRSSSR